MDSLPPDHHLEMTCETGEESELETKATNQRANVSLMIGGDASARHGDRPTPRKPQRFLDPALAVGIVEAKERAGLSWREVGRRAGRSHGFLILLAQGKRVPSQLTVEALADVLPLDDSVLAGLRDVAVRRVGRFVVA